MFQVWRKQSGRRKCVFSGTFNDHKWFMFGLLSQYKRIGEVVKVTGDIAYLSVVVNGKHIEYFSHC